MSKKDLKSNIEDLERIDRRLWDITARLPVKSGSIFKLSELAYENWGIEVTDENRERLKERADKFYGKDAVQSREVSPITKTSFRRTLERTMREFITSVSKAVMLSKWSKEKEEINVLDIGSGTGSTTAAIYGGLFYSGGLYTADLLPRIRWNLLDRSGSSLDLARNKLINLYGIPRGRVSTYSSDDVDFLKQTRLEFDLVVSVSHFHHKPFSDWYEILHERMSNDSFLLVGDWYSSLFQHPRGVYNLMRAMGADKETLADFSNLFDIERNPHFFDELTEMEENAVRDHVEHWSRICNILRDESMLGVSHPDVYLIEAHETTSQREKKMSDAGFDVDWKKVKDSFKERYDGELPNLPAKLINKSEFSSVLGAFKRSSKKSGKSPKGKARRKR